MQEKKSSKPKLSDTRSGTRTRLDTRAKATETRTGEHGVGVELQSRRRYLWGEEWVGRGPREPGFQKLILA